MGDRYIATATGHGLDWSGVEYTGPEGRHDGLPEGATGVAWANGLGTGYWTQCVAHIDAGKPAGPNGPVLFDRPGRCDSCAQHGDDGPGYDCAMDGDIDALGSLADALDREPDPLWRYMRASQASTAHQAFVERLGVIRRKAAAELHAAGESYAAIAAKTGLTRARVQQLVERGR